MPNLKTAPSSVTFSPACLSTAASSASLRVGTPDTAAQRDGSHGTGARRLASRPRVHLSGRQARALEDRRCTVDVRDDVADADRCHAREECAERRRVAQLARRAGQEERTGGGVVGEALRPNGGNCDLPLTCERARDPAYGRRVDGGRVCRELACLERVGRARSAPSSGTLRHRPIRSSGAARQMTTSCVSALDWLWLRERRFIATGNPATGAAGLG
jgi:hypothetical protein